MFQSAGDFDELLCGGFSESERDPLFRKRSILNSQAGVLLRSVVSISV